MNPTDDKFAEMKKSYQTKEYQYLLILVISRDLQSLVDFQGSPLSWFLHFFLLC